MGAGALCLSSWGIEQTTRTSTRPLPFRFTAPCPYACGEVVRLTGEDKHKAPTHPLRRPLSLRMWGD